MFAIKGYYKDGHIELAEPMPSGISAAELDIVVIPEQHYNGSSPTQR